MVTRSKFTTKSAPQAKSRLAEDVQAAYVEPEPEPLLSPLNGMFELFGALPSKKRMLCATIAYFATYVVGVHYAMALVEIVTLAAFMLTSSTFLALLLWAIGAVLVVWGAAVAGWAAAKFVLDFDAQRVADIGRDLREASARKVSLVRGWFKPAVAA